MAQSVPIWINWPIKCKKRSIMGSNGLKETKWAQSGKIGINGPITCKKRSIMGPNGLKEAK